MKENVIHPKQGLKLRKIGKQYMIVEANAEHINMSDVYSLNQTAALLWERIEAGSYTLDELAAWLCSLYDVTPDVILQDVERQLAEWKRFGLID